jgi:hypothetical protein
MWDPITNLLIGLGLELFFGIAPVVVDGVQAYREAEGQRPCASGSYRSSETKRCVRLTATLPPVIANPEPIVTRNADCRPIDPVTYEVAGGCPAGERGEREP